MFLFLLLGAVAALAAWHWWIRPRGGLRYLDATLRRTLLRVQAAVPASGAPLADLQRQIDRGLRAAIVVTIGGEGHVPPLVQVEAGDEDHTLLSQYWETVVAEQRAALARDQRLIVPTPFRMLLERADDVIPGRPRVVVPGGGMTQPFWENADYLRPPDARGGETVPLTAPAVGLDRAGSTNGYARLENGRRAPVALRAENVIGRSSRATIKVEDPSVSKLHARIRWAGDGWTIEDLTSLNGVFVDGRRIPANTRVPLGDGQRLGLGPTTDYHFHHGPPAPDPQA